MQAIAHNTATGAKSGVASPGTAAAVVVAERFLSDGQWHAVSAVRKIAHAFLCSFGPLADAAHLAQSDRGSWVCLPNVQSPLLAPDELEGEDAVSAADRQHLAVEDRRRVDVLLREALE